MEDYGAHTAAKGAHTPPRKRSHPPLYRARPLNMLEMMAWKSTSPLNMPCQAIVLTRDKCKNEFGHAIPFLHKYV